MYEQAELTRAKQLIDESQTIVILAPDSQDGDSIATNLALKMTLEDLGKTVYWIAAEGRNKSYDFLPGNEDCANPSVIDGKQDDVDLTIITDAGTWNMFGKVLEDRRWLIDKPTIIFDHHMVRDDMNTTVTIVADMGATGQLLYHVYRDLGWEITPDIARLFMLGIYNDTQLFTNLNTDQAILQVSADLAGLGAEPGVLAEQYKIIENPSPEGFRILQQMLDRTQFDGAVAYCLIPNELVRQAPSGTSIRHYVGNALRYLKGVTVSYVIVEKEAGTLQLSMRCHSGYDVAHIAQQFGGGGHKVAAGAVMHDFDSLSAANEQILKLAKEEASRPHANL